MTSLSVALGPKSLFQLGVSLTDIALLIDLGRKFGNFLRVSNNENSLLEALNEDTEALLRRSGLITPVRMQSLWPYLNFVHEGENKASSEKDKAGQEELSTFSWLMVVIITALDLCMTSTRIQDLLVDVLATVLDRKEDAEESLRIMLPTSIESWRSAGRVRRMHIKIRKEYTSTRSQHTEENTIPQLNLQEESEMRDFLLWLIGAKELVFTASSVDIYAFATAIAAAGMHLNTKEIQRHDPQPFVDYIRDSSSAINFTQLPGPHKPYFFGGAQQVSYQFGKPEDMIQSIRTRRDVLNSMGSLWELGSQAANKFFLTASSTLPFGQHSDVYYNVNGEDRSSSRFGPEIMRLQDNAFPVSSYDVLRALESITKGMHRDHVRWLDQHTQPEYLSRSETTVTSIPQEMEALLQYQALVFGFYYKLLEPLVVFNEVNEESYFQGIWGIGSNKFLRMCTQLGDDLKKDSGASRAQLLYMLSSMYNGRQKLYTKVSSRRGLVGIIGSISVVTLPLVRAVDTPREISKFMLFDLPVIDFASENDGEVYAANGYGIRFDNRPILERDIVPSGPKKKWTMHAKMGVQFEGSPNGVVMTARCQGRPVGWFDPIAADVLILSTAYCAQQETEFPEDHDEPSPVRAVEVKDENWQSGHVPLPIRENSKDGFVVVHSLGCPVLRYAATGFFGSTGSEIAISSGNFDIAFGRVEAQESGIIIA